MRIDEPGHDQAPGCINDFVHDVGCKIGANRKYFVVFDQNIGDRRLMDIALMVINLAASDQRSFRRHLTFDPPILCTGEKTCARRLSPHLAFCPNSDKENPLPKNLLG